MQRDSHFDPIEASQNLKSGFIDYITTTFPITDPVYRKAFRDALNQEGFLSRGPFLDMSGSYKAGRSLNDLMNMGLASQGFAHLEPVSEKDRELKLERPLYLHQERALLKAEKGKNLIVTTGTGSGKTECFLLPILQGLLQEEQERGELDHGVRAILIYPMNALANDQMKRMRLILKNYPNITFGVYTGNTRHSESDGKRAFHESYGKDAEILENERLSRESMRDKPPHILITNYSMLEYMLLRPKDDIVFSGAKLRYIVLDEAHVYKGTTGMETAMLMRRLRARVTRPKEGVEARPVQYILTSATLGGKDADQEITRFGYQLCGVNFDAEDIVRSEDATPEMKAHEDYPLELFHKLSDTANAVANVLAEYGISDPAPEGDDAEKLYELLLRCSLFAQLRKESAHTMELQALSKAMCITRQQLLDLVTVCTRAEKGKTALLKARIHYFVRALEGAYITLGADRQLMLTRQRETASGRAVFEAAICKDCGRLALVGQEEGEQLIQVSRKTDKDPKACDFFLLWDDHTNRDDEERIVFEDEEDDEITETDEADRVICACCGAISGKANLAFGNICECAAPDYVHVRQVRRTKSGNTAKCPACGHGEFRAFYLGSEAATSVLGTELFEQLPTKTVKPKPAVATAAAGKFKFGKFKPAVTEEERTPQFLCFSDSRSEAAHFAVYMEKSYQNFLRNRGIWQVVEDMKNNGEYVKPVKNFVNALTKIYCDAQAFDSWEPRRSHLNQQELEDVSKKNAWLAIIGELYRSRNTISLSSMGLLHFRYSSEKYNEQEDGILTHLMENGGLSKADADALMQRLFLDGVYTGALNAGKAYSLNEAERESIFYTSTPQYLVLANKKDHKSCDHGWLPRRRENGKTTIYYPNTRMHRVMKSTGWDEQEAYEFLQAVWEALELGDGQFAFDVRDFVICLNEKPDTKTWRCKRCGNVTAHNLQNRCAILQCDGELEAVQPNVLQEGNHYVKRYRGNRMKPLQMREHTAQLSRDCQTQYQQAFVDGKLNALSCSTTFEMGVDVGGLETVYMRDVPPGPANYVQRAGRAGRTAHTAAYVLTYAKLSSHDFTFYKNPEKVISGKIQAPVFSLENEKVLNRHIFAVALAEFFANDVGNAYHGNDRYYLLNDGGYERLKEYLAQPSQDLTELLKRSVPDTLHQELGIADGSWTDKLIGEKGVLELAVQNYRDERDDLKKKWEEARKAGDEDLANALYRMYRNLVSSPMDQKEKKASRKDLIDFLTRSNVLPKYGFPVDTVELQIGASGAGKISDLQLSRDLQMAIAEYAPGAQVIADGKMYTSRYLRKSGRGGPEDTGWEKGYYAKCSSCGQENFTKNYLIENEGGKCVSCGHQIKGWLETLEPRLGFISEDVNGKEVPMHRPERDYKTEDCYVGDRNRKVLESHEFQIGLERVRLEATKNDSLAVVGYGEHAVCPFCGFAANDRDVLPIPHKNARGYDCKFNGRSKVVRLAHTFKTDVVAITFWTPEAMKYEVMVSVMYALLEGLSKALDIERTDIKGCLHQVKWSGCGKPIYSIILYDAVAGGAGHVRRIVTEDGREFQKVMQKAYDIVTGCKCTPSCYSCIRNYYNQKIHDQLSRQKAADFLKNRLGALTPVQPEPEVHQTDIQGQSENLQLSAYDLGEDFSSWAHIADGSGIDCGMFDRYKVPFKNCLIMPTVELNGQELEEEQAYLVWEQPKVMLFDEIGQETKQSLTEMGWHVDTMEIEPEKLAEILKGAV